jgi:hypothetical protein
MLIEFKADIAEFIVDEAAPITVARPTGVQITTGRAWIRAIAD